MEKNIWNFKNDIYIKAIDYHKESINDSQYTYSQVYYPLVKGDYNDLVSQLSLNKKYKYSLMKKMSTQFNDKGILQLIKERKSFDIQLVHNFRITKSMISDFCNLSFNGLSDYHRSYPSGGNLYEVNIFLAFDEKVFSFYNRNICFLDHKSDSLWFIKSDNWLKNISRVFIQKDLFKNSKFAIFLSVNLDRIFKKYTDIGYKLVQQETGYIGQNIQLVSTAMGMQSIALQGYYDKIANSIIGNNQSVLSAFLIG